MPPSVLLSVKLLLLYLVTHGMPTFHVYLPFLPWLDHIRDATALRPLTHGAMWALTFMVLCNCQVRPACLLLGTLIIFRVLASRPTFSNNRIFFGCMFFLAGLTSRKSGPILMQLQVSLVYLGAGINKLFEPDWRSGQYFEHWTRHVLNHQSYAWLADQCPTMLLSQSMCLLTIVVELFLAVGLMLPRTRKHAIAIGLAFHFGTLVFTGGALSWVFCYAMACSYTVFLPWPVGSKSSRCQHPSVFFGLAFVFLAIEFISNHIS